MRTLISDMMDELDKLNARIGAFDAEIKELVQSDPVLKRLTEKPGVRPMIASALVSAIGNGQAFAKETCAENRQFEPRRDRSAACGK